MAGKVFYTNNTFDTVESEFEYTEFTVMAAQVADRPSWGGFGEADKAVSLTLYEHDSTGLMVRDVGAFEDWLRKLVVR